MLWEISDSKSTKTSPIPITWLYLSLLGINCKKNKKIADWWNNTAKLIIKLYLINCFSCRYLRENKNITNAWICLIAGSKKLPSKKVWKAIIITKAGNFDLEKIKKQNEDIFYKMISDKVLKHPNKKSLEILKKIKLSLIYNNDIKKVIKKYN